MPLLSHGEPKTASARSSIWHVAPRRIASSFINSIRWVLSTLVAPGAYLIAYLYDESGRFAPLLQLRKLFGVPHGNSRKLAMDYPEAVPEDEQREQPMSGDHASASALAAPPRRGHGLLVVRCLLRVRLGGGEGAPSSAARQ